MRKIQVATVRVTMYSCRKKVDIPPCDTDETWQRWTRSKIIWKQYFGIVTAPQGDTTNLYNHLQRHNNIQYELAMKEKWTTLKKYHPTDKRLSSPAAYYRSCLWKPCVERNYLFIFFIYLCAKHFFVVVEKKRESWSQLSGRKIVIHIKHESCSPVMDTWSQSSTWWCSSAQREVSTTTLTVSRAATAVITYMFSMFSLVIGWGHFFVTRLIGMNSDFKFQVLNMNNVHGEVELERAESMFLYSMWGHFHCVGPDFWSMTHCWSLKGQLKVWMQNARTVYVTKNILLSGGRLGGDSKAY